MDRLERELELFAKIPENTNEAEPKDPLKEMMKVGQPLYSEGKFIDIEEPSNSDRILVEDPDYLEWRVEDMEQEYASPEENKSIEKKLEPAEVDSIRKWYPENDLIPTESNRFYHNEEDLDDLEFVNETQKKRQANPSTIENLESGSEGM